jgi:translation initiation factor 3 subunit D
MPHHFRKELLNNHLKITKWGVQTYLAGVEYVKIGFVTRNSTKKNTEHTLVGFSDIMINELLMNTNFNKQIAYRFN